MSKFIIIIILLFSISCSNSTLNGPKDTTDSNIPEYVLNNGKVILVNLNVSDEIKSISCNDKDIVFFNFNKNIKFYLSEDYFSGKNSYQCHYISVQGDKKVTFAKVNVEDFKYPEEILSVDEKKVSLSPKDLKRALNEQAMLNKIFAQPLSTPFFAEKFELPIDSLVTSHYGTRRVFNNKKKGQHLGTDFRAAIGTKIVSSNRGKVVFSGDLFFGGKTVVLDHGATIFTIYSHLDKIIAKKESIVEKGDVVGLSGKTGRVSGPHLHWGARVQGFSIDAVSLAEAGF